MSGSENEAYKAEIARLIKQLAEKDAERDAALAEKDAELAKKDAERDAALAEKDAERDAALAEKDAELAKKDADHAAEMEITAVSNLYTDACTIKEVYLRDATPYLPPIKLNPAVKPSTGSSARKGVTIPEAEITPCHEDTFIDPKDVVIPTHEVNADGMEIKLPSKLGPSSFSVPYLEYLNETAAQSYSACLVEDAIRCLGLSDKLKSHLEVTLYSMIPDIIVIEYRGCPLFPIEIKSPELKKGQVFMSRNVHGQIWIYLMILKQLGRKNPIGAIMTYNKIRLVSLSDLGRRDEGRSELLERCKNSLSSGTVMPHPIEEKPAKEYPSPVKKEIRLNKVNKRSEHESFKDNEDTDIHAEVYVSPVHEGGLVFPSLISGILVAYEDCDTTSMANELPVVEAGDDLGRRLFVRATEESFSFVWTKKNLFATCEFPRANAKNFYMLSQLGKGKAGSTYLVATENGSLAAAKLYVPERSKCDTEEARSKEWDKRIKDLEKKRNNEGALWKKLNLNYQTRDIKLMGVPALLMPYGTELFSVDERWKSLKMVEAELTKYASAGYVYEKQDLRWRHVLQDAEKKIFLGDLESLVAIPDDIEPMEAVKNQLSLLMKRIEENAEREGEMKQERNAEGELEIKQDLSTPHSLKSVTFSDGSDTGASCEDSPTSSVGTAVGNCNTPQKRRKLEHSGQ